MTINDLQSFKREVILALFADNALMQQLVLKGGNLLDVVYGISTRPSRDIDLSICGEIEDLDRFRATIDKRSGKWFEPKGYVVFDVNLWEEPSTSPRSSAISGVVTRLISRSSMPKRTRSWPGINASCAWLR